MKYTYYKIIQGNYGQGWEDVDAHECASTGYMDPKARGAFRENLTAYRDNEPGPHRVIFRRELN